MLFYIVFAFIADIDFSIGIFANLQELHLDMCPLSTVEDIYVLKDRLRFLYITNTGVPDLQQGLLPIASKHIRKLAPMILAPSVKRENSLTQPDLHWGKLEMLRTINCGITCIDQTLHFMPKLTMLDMSFNDITHIVHLQDCSLLSTINLSHNRVRVLSNLSRVLGNLMFLIIILNLLMV